MHQTNKPGGYKRLYIDWPPKPRLGNVFDAEDVLYNDPRRRQQWRGWILGLGLPIVYTIIFAVSMSHNWKHGGGMFSLTDSPAKHLGVDTHLEVFPLDRFLEGPYTGEPGPALDTVWENLLQYNNMRIPEEWVQNHGRESQAVKLPDGGYLGVLSVFHELHCIKRVFRTLHSDYYFPNATEEIRKDILQHAEHCLELFRMSAMCRGDVSVLTHRWVDGDSLPHVNQSAPHQCINWDRVMEYAKSVSVNVFLENYIVNPKTGINPYW